MITYFLLYAMWYIDTFDFVCSKNTSVKYRLKITLSILFIVTFSDKGRFMNNYMWGKQEHMLKSKTNPPSH